MRPNPRPSCSSLVKNLLPVKEIKEIGEIGEIKEIGERRASAARPRHVRICTMKFRVINLVESRIDSALLAPLQLRVFALKLPFQISCQLMSIRFTNWLKSPRWLNWLRTLRWLQAGPRSCFNQPHEAKMAYQLGVTDSGPGSPRLSHCGLSTPVYNCYNGNKSNNLFFDYFKVPKISKVPGGSNHFLFVPTKLVSDIPYAPPILKTFGSSIPQLESPRLPPLV